MELYLIQGPHGIGKTTAIKVAVEKSSANVFYFAIDNVEDFGVKLASALSSSVNCTIKLDTYNYTTV